MIIKTNPLSLKRSFFLIKALAFFFCSWYSVQASTQSLTPWNVRTPLGNSTFSYPSQMSIGLDGSLFVASPNASALYKIDPITGAKSVFSAGNFNTPNGIVPFGGAGGFLVSDLGDSSGGTNPSLSTVDSNGGSVTASSITFQADKGTQRLAPLQNGSAVFVDNTYKGIVQVLTGSVTAQPLTISSISASSNVVSLSPTTDGSSQAFYYADRGASMAGSGLINKVTINSSTPVTTTVTPFATGLSIPISIATLPNNRGLYASNFNNASAGTGDISKYNASGTVEWTISDSSLIQPDYLQVLSDQSLVFMTGNASNTRTLQKICGDRLNITDASGVVTLDGDAVYTQMDGVANSQINLNGHNLTFGLAGQRVSSQFDGDIMGSSTETLTKDGTGLLTLSSGVSSNIGRVVINQGTLAGPVPSGHNSLFIANGAGYDPRGVSRNINNLSGDAGSSIRSSGFPAMLTINNSVDTVFSGSMNPSISGLIKQGNGNLTLNGTNSNVNLMQLQAGGLTGNAASFPIDIDTSNNTTLTMNQATNATWGRIITGSGNFVKAGNGILTLSSASTYSGSTTIQAGTLKAPISANSSSLIIAASANYDLGGNARTINNPQGGGSIINSGTAADLTINSATNTAFTGSISNQIRNFIKTGSSNLSLAGAVLAYSGSTNIQQGALAGSIPATSSLTVASGASYDVLGVNSTISGLNGAGTILSSATPVTLTVSGSTNSTFSGSMTNITDFIKDGSSTLTLTASPGYSGVTQVSGGTLKGPIPAASSLTINNGATYDVNQGSSSLHNITGKGILQNSQASSTITLYSAINSLFSGTITASVSNIIKDGPGQLSLVGATVLNSGSTVISEGVIVGPINPASSLNISATAALDLNGSSPATIANLSGAGQIQSSNANSDLIISSGQGTAFAGIINNQINNFTKTGSNKLDLSGATLDYQGSTTIQNGTLIADIPPTSSLSIEESGTYDLNGGDRTVTSLSGQGLIRSSTIDAGLTINSSANSTFSGSFDSSLSSITKRGGASFTFTSPSPYSGDIFINAGSISSSSSSLQGDITNNGTLTFTESVDNSFNGSILGGGQFIKQGIGSLTMSDASVCNNSININQGTLIGSSSSLPGNITNNASLVFNQSAGGTYGGIISSTGSFEKQGSSNLVLSNGNIFSGQTRVSAGQLSLAHAQALQNTSGITLDSSTLQASVDGLALTAPITVQGTDPSLAMDSTVSSFRLRGAVSVVNGTILHTPVSSSQTLIFDNLGGSGTLHLLGGGKVQAVGNSPHLNIENGTFEITGGNYGGGGAVDTTLGRQGLIQVDNGATLALNSLSYSLGDGSVSPDASSITCGKIINQNANAASLVLPATVNVNSDDTVTQSDYVKLPTGSQFQLIQGPYSGSPVLNTTVGSGIITWGLASTANSLNLVIQDNTLLPSNTNDSGRLLHDTLEDVADSLMEMRLDGELESDLILPDKESFKSKQEYNYKQHQALYQQLANLARSFKKHNNPSAFGDSGSNLMPSSSLAIMEEKSNTPLAFRNKDRTFALWFGTLLVEGKNRRTAFSSASRDHQEGVMMGLEWRSLDQERYLGLNLGATMGGSSIDTMPNNKTRTKTALMSGYFSQGFLKEAEWDSYFTAAKAFSSHQRVAKPTVSQEMFIHSRSTSYRYSVGSQLGYKIKWKDQETQKSLFSIKPFAGALYSYMMRPGFSERNGGAYNIRHQSLNIEGFNAYTGLGIRQRWNTENYSLKLTGQILYSQNINQPKIQDRIWVNGGTASGILVDSPSLSKRSFEPSLGVGVSPKNNKWKFYLRGACNFQDARTSKSLFARFSIPL